MIKTQIKSALRRFGYKLERIDPLEESIPADYNHSPFLPRIYRGALDRYLYFKDMVESVGDVEGDVVEWGDPRSPGATKAIDEFFADKPESVLSHAKCSWKYHVRKAQTTET